MEQVPSLARLLKVLQQVPYGASKNIYRIASYFLEMDQEKLDQFCRTLAEAKRNVITCERCCCWQERTDQCIFCSSTSRNQQLVCVVESWQELLAIEKTGGYTGVYHVLGGLIFPLNGVGPEDLSINELLARVESGAVNEVIFALSQTPEGEATAAYIAHKMRGMSVAVTSLAKGVPVGSTLVFMDRLTLHKALSERRPF